MQWKKVATAFQFSNMFLTRGTKQVMMSFRGGSKTIQQQQSSLSSVTSSIPNSPISASEQAAEDARNAAKTFGFSDFEAWLTTGGDDRSLILEGSGANKYHIKPQAIEKTDIFRGSCTGNPPTTRGYAAAKKLFEERLNGVQGPELDLTLRDVFATQRYRLGVLLNLPRGAEVILCPSGSDAEYIPLAIAKTLRPNAVIKNGVTQLNEIGAGTAPAAVGEYFSTHAPFIGELNGLEILDGFSGFDGPVISARTKDGEVIDASHEMNIFKEECIKNNHYPILHGVFGGKTGIRDNEMPSSLDEGKTSLGIVDACQGRFTAEELQQWLEQDSIVLFTTSKFYQAPPFCGAVIVPSSIAEQLYQSSTPPVEMLVNNGLGAYLTDKELPRCLDVWKSFLRDERKNNVGLALRWEAGLEAMEALAHVSDEKRTAAVDEWAKSVTKMVNDIPGVDPWCVERSIISIRVSNNDGGWLNMSQARDLFRWISMDVSSAVPEASEEEKAALSKVAYIGQPVSVSESHAIVRIALGVESLISYMKDKDATLQEDLFTVKKLAAISKHFSTLKASGL